MFFTWHVKMIRAEQRKRILQIINCNSQPSDESNLTWKVLIYDDRGASILASVLDFSSNLAEYGVTFHSSIKSKRTSIQDVPAVYFIEPNEENVLLILKDIKENVYDHFYINFISHISSDRLRDFAKEVAKISDGRSIGGIFDSYLDFTSRDDRRIELFDNDSFFEKLYGLKLQDSDLEVACENISDRIISVIKTCNQVPLILAKGELSKICAEMLSKKLQPILNILKNDNRPLLILADRSLDFVTMVHHGASYNALIDDLLEIDDRNGLLIGPKKRNSIFFNEDENVSEFKINKEHDHFWKEHCHKSFDYTLSQIKNYVQNFTNDYQSIENDVNAAIINMGELKSKRESMETHTKLCSQILALIQERKLDQLYHKEIECITNSSFKSVDKVFDISTLNSNDDKIRLLTVAYMTNSISDNDVEESVKGAEISFLKKFSGFKTFSQKGSSFFSSVAKRFTKNENILSRMPIAECARKALNGDDNVFDSVINLQQNVPVVRKNAIVIVIGGGCRNEFDGFEMLNDEKGSEGIEVTYGCTSFLRPDDFIHKLANLS